MACSSAWQCRSQLNCSTSARPGRGAQTPSRLRIVRESRERRRKGIGLSANHRAGPHGPSPDDACQPLDTRRDDRQAQPPCTRRSSAATSRNSMLQRRMRWPRRTARRRYRRRQRRRASPHVASAPVNVMMPSSPCGALRARTSSGPVADQHGLDVASASRAQRPHRLDEVHRAVPRAKRPDEDHDGVAGCRANGTGPGAPGRNRSVSAPHSV